MNEIVGDNMNFVNL